MEDNKYLEVLSDKIILNRTSLNPYYEAKLTLTNLTNKYVVFKVYINKHTLYSANPASSFISPKENLSITIKRLENVYYIKAGSRYRSELERQTLHSRIPS
jgi:hypothetical protein